MLVLPNLSADSLILRRKAVH